MELSVDDGIPSHHTCEITQRNRHHHYQPATVQLLKWLEVKNTAVVLSQEPPEAPSHGEATAGASYLVHKRTD